MGFDWGFYWILLTSMMAVCWIITFIAWRDDPGFSWHIIISSLQKIALSTVLCILPVGFVAWITYNIIGEVTGHAEEVGDWDIVALNLGSNVEGSFFLASGYISEVPYYTYMGQDSNGGMKLYQVPASDVVIYELEPGSNEAPHIVMFKDVSHVAPGMQTAGSEYYHIYVPDGSVYNGFNVDVRDVG